MMMLRLLVVVVWIANERMLCPTVVHMIPVCHWLWVTWSDSELCACATTTTMTMIMVKTSEDHGHINIVVEEEEESEKV